MDEFELGKQLTQFSNRIANLESRMKRISADNQDTLLEVQPLEEVFIGDEVAFDMEREVVPGSCPSRFVANWQNKKVEFKVCAKSGDEAEDKANKQLEEKIKEIIRNSAGLDCSSRPGCAAPATCKEEFSPIKGKQLGKWNCVNSGNQGECKAGETEWTCTGWFNLKATLRCKCKK